MNIKKNDLSDVQYKHTQEQFIKFKIFYLLYYILLRKFTKLVSHNSDLFKINIVKIFVKTTLDK